MKARLLIAHLGPPFSFPATTTNSHDFRFLVMRFGFLFLPAVEYLSNQLAKPRY